MDHRVVVVGAGFAGLQLVRDLAGAPCRITLIDQRNHHLFQPLLYQVATGILSEGEIAPSTRLVLRNQRNAQVLLGDVTGIDLAGKFVTSDMLGHTYNTPFDSLIIAAGAGQSYFGNDQFAEFAPGMKTIDDALELRSRIFWAFELAERTADKAERDRLLTFVVVGAGPTGVEMAGQIRELSTTTLKGQFSKIDPVDARVILIDGADQVLPPFGKALGAATRRSLETSGVEVVLGGIVTAMDADSVTYKLKDGTEQRIESSCKVWAAGVEANPLGRSIAEQAGAEVDRAGRVIVQPDLTLPGHPEVTVIGDLAFVPGVPGVAQGAIQEARYVAPRIAARVAGEPVSSEPFAYHDKGSMATISKFAAVVKVGKIELTGFIAWVMWLVLHLFYIAGFKGRVTTLMHWTISFFSNGRAERATTHQQLIARLALDQLGARVTGKLLRGELAPPEGERRSRG